MTRDDLKPNTDRRLARLAIKVGVWAVFLLVLVAVCWLEQPSPHEAETPPAVPRVEMDSVPDAEPPAGGGPSDGRESSATRRRRAPDDHSAPAPDGADNRSEPEAGSRMRPNVAVRDREGRVVFRGTIDIEPTLERIREGARLPFEHDGSTFQNREGRLPRQPAGYYREYVQPTPGTPGPGPQRVIVGRQGEIFYTFDHYRTFRRIE